jgi:hypothetical protein
MRWKYFPFINFENPLYFRLNFRWLWGLSKRPPNETKLQEVLIYIYVNDIQPKQIIFAFNCFLTNPNNLHTITFSMFLDGLDLVMKVPFSFFNPFLHGIFLRIHGGAGVECTSPYEKSTSECLSSILFYTFTYTYIDSINTLASKL